MIVIRTLVAMENINMDLVLMLLGGYCLVGFDTVFGPTYKCILYTRYNGLRCSTGVRIEADRVLLVLVTCLLIE